MMVEDTNGRIFIVATAVQRPGPHVGFVLDACLDLNIVLRQNEASHYFCVQASLSACPRNRLWHRRYHGVLDEIQTWRPFLNKYPKRKVNSSVVWKKGERLFGQDAFNTVRSLSVFRAQVSDSDSCVQGSRFPLPI
jgi:hypothetical protein